MYYINSIQGITSAQLQGFFVGWPNPPSPEQHLALLQQSTHVVLAQIENGRVVGFVTAITDGVLNAHIPLLEVLPEFRNQGVGTELMQRMLAELRGFYAVNLICDPPLRAFYERLGFANALGMVIRRPTDQESS